MTRNDETARRVSDEGWTLPIDPTNPRLGRRTVLAGAAWSVPVIAATIATPLAAASTGQPTLEFTQPNYSACGTLVGVQVRQTTDGATPATGEPITVTLSDGYTFGDGSTTYTGVSDATGAITLPTILVPTAGGDSAFAAASGDLTAAATVTGNAPGGDVIYSSGVPVATVPGGRQIVDMGMSTTPAGEYGIDIVATDGTNWRYNYNAGTWYEVWPGGGPYEHVAASEAGLYITATGSTIYSAAVPVATVPGGLQILDLAVTTLANGEFAADVIASDGTNWKYNFNTDAWYEVWPGAGPFEHVATSEGGLYVTSAGSIVYSGATPLPTVPGGRQVVDLAVKTEQNGDYAVDIIASDGTNWRYNFTTGVWYEVWPEVGPFEHVASSEGALYVTSGPGAC